LKDFKVYNGQIYAFGRCITPGTYSNDGIVIRLTTNGQLDTTFGNNGLVRFDLGSDEFFNDLLVNDDGSFYALGTKQTTVGPNSSDTSNCRILLCKYLSNGSLDTSFNATGSKIFTDTLEAKGISIFQYQNGILLANWGASTVTAYSDVYLKKIDFNGNLITNFGNGGNLRMQTSNFGSSFRTSFNAIKLVGTKIYCDYYWSVTASYNGRVITRYHINNPTAATVDFLGNYLRDSYFEPLSSGKVLIANGIFASCGISGACNHTKINLKQLNLDGTLDTSFDGDGQFDYDFNSGNVTEGASYLYVHADGRIFIAGGHSGGSNLGMIRIGSAELGVDDLNAKKGFSVYPNPSSAILYINNKNNAFLEKIFISDISGKVLETSINNENGIDISVLSKGIYFLSFTADGALHKLKFIKS
jgi:uncharacterized delta-60 repeat protein